MAPERPRPDIDHIREAMREHDERAEPEEPDEESVEPDEPEADDDG